MSFNVEYTAETAAGAEAILESDEYMVVPDCVKDFIRAAIKAATGPVHVKANGHLYNKDYQISSASIEVRPLQFKAVPPAT